MTGDEYDADAPQLTLPGTHAPPAQGTWGRIDGRRRGTGPTCAACGARLTEKYELRRARVLDLPTCDRCHKAKHHPARLDLDPTEPEPDDDQPLRPGGYDDLDPVDGIEPDEPATDFAHVTDDRTPAERHRDRCDGPMMAGPFGIGRRSCLACDWSPDDPEPEPEPGPDGIAAHVARAVELADAYAATHDLTNEPAEMLAVIGDRIGRQAIADVERTASTLTADDLDRIAAQVAADAAAVIENMPEPDDDEPAPVISLEVWRHRRAIFVMPNPSTA